MRHVIDGDGVEGLVDERVVQQALERLATGLVTPPHLRTGAGAGYSARALDMHAQQAKHVHAWSCLSRPRMGT